MLKALVKARVKNSFLTKQFEKQFSLSEKAFVLVLPYSNVIERFLVESLIEETSDYTLVNNDQLNRLKAKEYCILAADQIESYENLPNEIYLSFYISWKRKTRYKESSIKSRSPFNFFKLKRLFFNKKNIFICMNQHGKVSTKAALENYFEQMTYSLNGPVLAKRKELQTLILSEEKVEKHIKGKKTSKLKLLRYIREIHTTKRITMVSKLRRILDIIWRLTLEGVYVDQKGLEAVREISKEKQLIYVPSHRSHADYLMIGYILYKYGLDTPLTAAGINLSFFPIGSIFRRAGAYFIRRSFKGNPTYSLTFRMYLRVLMQSRNSQMFYIEGGRSRAGKLLSPKLGMLSMLTDCIKDGDVDNFYFVPLSVEYGKLFEGQSYKDELTGAEKEKESIFAMFNMLKYLKRRQGITYVQFAEPFSAKAFFEKENLAELSIKEYNQSVRNLGFSIIHRINSVVTVTPSAIISLILLSNPKRGIPHNELLRSSKLIYHYLKTKNLRLAIDDDGFDSAFASVLSNFEYNAYISKVRYFDQSIYRTQNRSRLYLDYYKNNIIHLFLPLAFIATILKSHEEDEIEFSLLYEKIDELKEIFYYEFVFNDEIWSEKNLLEALKFFAIVKEIKLMKNSLIMQKTKKRWIDITYHIIRNFLEGYYLVCIQLQELEEAQPQKTFLTKLNEFSRQMFEVGEIQMIESNSKDIYQNVLSFCCDKKWLSQRGKQVQLIEANKDGLDDFVEKIRSYLE